MSITLLIIFIILFISNVGITKNSSFLGFLFYSWDWIFRFYCCWHIRRILIGLDFSFRLDFTFVFFLSSERDCFRFARSVCQCGTSNEIFDARPLFLCCKARDYFSCMRVRLHFLCFLNVFYNNLYNLFCLNWNVGPWEMIRGLALFFITHTLPAATRQDTALRQSKFPESSQHNAAFA
jgi:hypothetical protein